MLSATLSPTNHWASPEVSAPSEDSHLSDVCALLALMVTSQTANQTGSRNDIEIDAKHLDQLKQQMADAVRQAQEAQHKSGLFGFLSNVFGKDIAEIAGAVAAAAAVVATGGAAAPLVLLALSSALEVGAKVGQELGLDPKICLGMSLAGAALGLCAGGSGQAVGTIASAARGVKASATAVEGGATVAGGALGAASGHEHAQSLHHQADATAFQMRTDSTNVDIDDALQMLADSLRSEQHETGIVSAILKDQADANNTLSERV